MNIVLYASMLVAAILNICLHITCCYLLVCLYKNGEQTFQQIYLINLSVSEIVMTAIVLACSILGLLPCSGFGGVVVIRNFIHVVGHSGANTVYYLSTMYVTVDRLLEIALNLRYPVYWSLTKTKYLLLATWFFGIVVAGVSFSFTLENTSDVFTILYSHFFPILNTVFLVTAIFSYYFIFAQYKRTRVIPVRSRIHTSALRVYRNSRFHIPMIIILSFFIFNILPDIIGYLLSSDETATELMVNVCFLLTIFLGILSSYVYVFIKRPVKLLLKKKRKELLRRYAGVLMRFGYRSGAISPINTTITNCSTANHPSGKTFIVDDYSIRNRSVSPRIQSQNLCAVAP